MERLKRIKYPPLKDKFKKYGDSFELVSKNESNRMYCYRRTTPGRDCIFRGVPVESGEGRKRTGL